MKNNIITSLICNELNSQNIPQKDKIFFNNLNFALSSPYIILEIFNAITETKAYCKTLNKIPIYLSFSKPKKLKKSYKYRHI